MNLQKIADTLNTEHFKEQVELLFSKSLRSEIDFDFSISVKESNSTQIEVKAYDTSYDCDGMGIPNLVAVLDSNTLSFIEQEVLNQFKLAVDLLED
jgi:hypothetical protein